MDLASLVRTSLVLAFSVTSATSATSASDCVETALNVLGRNEPELLLLWDAGDAAEPAYRLNVDWGHIDALLDKQCVKSYLVEHERHVADSNPRSKRESASASSVISPPLGSSATNHSLRLSLGCDTYTVRIVVMIQQGQSQVRLVHSKTRGVWPAAQGHAHLQVFSDAVVVSWPKDCAAATNTWTLSVCDDDEEEAGNCTTQTLEGEEQSQAVNLRACAEYRVELANEFGAVWTQSEVRTLPRPEISVKADSDRLHVRIGQEGCVPKAMHSHWKITYCKRKSKPRALPVPVVRREEHDDAIEGSSDQDDDDEYYYYDSAVSDDPCHTVMLHDATQTAASLAGLEACTLYALDITPVDAAGRSVQPGEQFGTIYSTLCAGHHKDSDVWIENDKDGGDSEDPLTNPTDAKLNVASFYALVAFGVVASIAVVVSVGVFVVFKRRRAKKSSEVQSSTSSITLSQKQALLQTPT